MLRFRKPLLPEWRWWPAVALAILVFVAVGGFVSSGTRVPRQPTHTAEQQQQHKHPVNERPSIFLAIGTWVGDNHDAIEALATALLTFVTGILVWVAYRQFTTTRAQLRAYVYVSAVQGFITRHGDKTNIVVHLTIKNFGSTPAYKLESWMGIWAANFPTVEFPAPPPDFQTVSATLPPGGTYDLVQGGDITANLNAITQSKKAIYAYGGMRYRDAFNIERNTRFRLRCAGERGLAKGTFDYCLQGNDAD